MQSTRAGRVSERAQRGLTEIQRKVIRHMVNQPGKTLKEYADAVFLDRSAVSRWVHHDPAFQAALEEARSAPRPAMTAEAIFEAIDAMEPVERRKVAAALGGDGSGGPFAEIKSEFIEIDDLKRRIRNEKWDQKKLFAEIYNVFCFAGALFNIEGFDERGRLVDPKGVLSRLLDKDEEEVRFFRQVLHSNDFEDYPVEGQFNGGSEQAGGKESTKESGAALGKPERGERDRNIEMLEQDIKERREILETSYQAEANGEDAGDAKGGRRPF